MRTIVVTGDSRGLGAEITRALLRDDETRVVGISRARGEATKRLEEEAGDRYRHIDFDLGRPEAIPALYRDHLKPLGPLHGLVNNAAMPYDDIVTNAKLDPLRAMFDVNVVAPILLTKFVLRDMLLHQTRGSLVHVTSVSTQTGYKGLSMYAATKGALESFSKGVAREWGKMGVRSNCVAPGFMETEMTASLGEAQKDRIYARTALRSATEPHSVSQVVLLLLSDESASITGEVIRVDAGTV